MLTKIVDNYVPDRVFPDPLVSPLLADDLDSFPRTGLFTPSSS